ncbi:MAG: tryptophan--tRNA ligase [Parcubacteria group bacterium CG1_02_39_15]|uniref:Tryptophan--tRNA ligase n=3 Tax=Candidatus Nealsoniibacteriota TaxID=1817911 RepID=A0A2G9YT07_9BACT|nr:MAG: tryptophan--tRNA ligase [Parcubacteria group bacterium CG1_02_39_15]PIP22358.1 MAG: tryptophan--tRNA ligase [Candidatus Nealsonbacteria bacterium CG23_combo_of_CG06-09_8_20_14_all_39_25]PIW90233.1 MAG: tryptophan--tRNA ligase [Candidatus Nealsonbacteria bacterium CG_4_8_14_3_um_filter_40_11]PIZ88124.1 MAG: tryptophan--tRNA ligase [Candidatus Nealsonbacteria bacterium CG_4_10_14_0_2_um_filter_39_15]
MRVFSGIRPTGELHIGNYLGAIKQWIELQEKTECVFCIVDLHAVTTPYEPENLQANIKDVAIAYLAAGLNPEKCIFFVQSEVKEHTELTWLLGTITPLGDLQRMTQFKEKSKKHKEYVNAGLLNYPILMAADILLYKTDLVPVGKDQEQHVELARTIARKFNKTFGEVFKEPKVVLPKIGAKIMSLQKPAKKMSKTDDPRGCIGLFDEPEEIEKKILAAVTDTGRAIRYNPKLKPGISNLLTIYSLFSGKGIKELERKFKGKGYADFKKSLAELLINSLEPFRRKRKELLQREVYVKEILAKGQKRAQIIAQSTLQDVKKKMGLT